jgi:hypothetical protein
VNFYVPLSESHDLNGKCGQNIAMMYTPL